MTGRSPSGRAADILRKARALVERGWTRGEYCKGGRVCSIGALQKAANGHPEDCSTSKTLSEAQGFLREAVGFSIVSFNDRQTSKKPVLAAFDKAIELAEAQS